MTVLVAVETVLLVVLTVLVAGLLRAYATVLRRLHDLDGGEHSHGPKQFSLENENTAVAPPVARTDWTEGHDLSGETINGEIVTTRVVGVEHDSVLLFLSSGCESCAVFWRELATAGQMPDNTRLVIVTQGEEFESRGLLADLASPGLDVLMSTPAWRDYEVPGSPHVVYVEGRTGRVRGEGTGQSWGQVAQLLARASGDASFLGGTSRLPKPDRDAQVEAEVDRELMAAGILPGDPRLYGDDQ